LLDTSFQGRFNYKTPIHPDPISTFQEFEASTKQQATEQKKGAQNMKYKQRLKVVFELLHVALNNCHLVVDGM
jgi:hypothetical protein